MQGIQTLHRFIKTIQPWGITFTFVGIFLAVYELNVAREERRYEQRLREATLYAMASEMLQKAREVDEKTGKPGTAQIGQVRVMETTIRIGVSLEGINGSSVRLDDAQFENAKFSGANFWEATFLGSNLSGANLENALFSRATFGPSNRKGKIIYPSLSNANLTMAQFTEAKLLYVDLSGANFKNAKLRGMQLVDVDLRDVQNLTEKQLEGVCGSNVKLPDRWSIRNCKDE